MLQKILLIGLISGACVIGSVDLAFAQDASAPSLKYVMTLYADLSPGVPVADNRIIVDVPGGWVKTADGGTGTVVTPCADWLHVLPNGTFKLDVRCTSKMDDDSTIMLEYTGRLKFSEAGLAKFQNGEATSGDDFYFIASPTMQTMSEKYGWVNDAVFISKGVALGPGLNSVKYEVYLVQP